MEQNQPRLYREEEEIQLGSLWSNIKGSFRYIFRKWYWLLLGIVICAGLGFGYSKWYGKKYIATTTFAVQGQTAQNALLSSALSLASSLGLGSGGGGQSGYDNNFFANLLQSRRVIMEAMLGEATVKGKKDLLANHYIDLYAWRDDWEDDPRLKDFHFTTTDLGKMTRLEDSIMQKIYESVIDNNLEVVFDDALPFNTATFITRNSDFSRNMLSGMLELSSVYYMRDIYGMNKRSLDVADFRVDSLAQALRELDNKVASLKDVTNNVIKQKGFIELNEAIRNQSLMNIQYSSAVNNVELARVTLLTNAPILQIIDDPKFSTEVSFVSLPLAIIIGAIVGAFLTGIILFIARAVEESAEKERKRKELQSQQAA